MKKKGGLLSEPYILPWIGIFLAGWLLVILLSGRGAKKDAPGVVEGRAFIEAEAAKDPADVDRAVHQQMIERMRAQAEADRAAAKNEIEENVNGAASVWSEFKDYVILGDSRAVGFYYYKFLDRSRVFADGGYTIRNIPDYLDEIRVLNPSYIYLCFGLNDTGIGYWSTAEEYAAELDERITELQAAAPGVTVVVNSILPATEAAMVRSPVWRKIPSFSAAAKELCEQKGVAFADNDALAEQFMDLYWDVDGVHLKPDFYQYWAKNMLIAALEAELG